MDRNSNKYTLIYSVVMVIIVATALTLIAVGLGPRQEKNVSLEKKSNILKTINISSTNEDVEELYDKYIIDALVINRNGERVDGVDAFNISLKEEQAKQPGEQLWPLYVAKIDDGSMKYIFTLNGKGLWGGIWGYLSLNDDLNTVYGVNFDHASETPGLGAEISTPAFQEQFKGKEIFDGNTFVSIDITKRGAKDNIHAVDAISGGTITSNGVKDMLKDCLSAYMKYIEVNKK